ncbi:SCO family protein [Streptomyces sp. URMC 123]|uniref:SCO family protein n=1 Tax=Streptomyces sp. URMC 123 TaxID=3423403 RepID=UPI003F19D0DC
MRKTPVLAVALAATAALTLSACSGGSGGSDGSSVADVSSNATAQKAATVLDRPFAKPDLVLTDTKGEKFDLIERTKGKPTLIYFGYTNCPDVCPLTMSNLAIARKKLADPKDREQLQVVFVTSDPERDTPERLGAWLTGQDPAFIGLTGDFATIQAGARSVGVGIEPSKKEANGDIVSTHGAQVLAFSPKDDKAHVIYGEKATADDFAKDLPKIIKGETP